MQHSYQPLRMVSTDALDGRHLEDLDPDFTDPEQNLRLTAMTWSVGFMQSIFSVALYVVFRFRV